MSIDAVLEYVKSELNMSGTFHDEMLKSYIKDVAEYMVDAGVSQAVMATTAVYGCISRGVMDLWNYGAGEGKLSTYFRERVIQLSMKGA